MHDNHPLIAAAEAGDLARVTELLATEPVNVRGWMGITPLIAATWHADSAEIVRLLLAHGADPLAVRTHGDGALHWAASGEVASLLAEAAGSAGLAARYLFDQTPLHVAAKKGHADVVHAFLAAGADPAAVDENGDMPLDLAGDPDVARVLVEAGAPLRTRKPSTPLHNASRRLDEAWAPVVELMLARGADPLLRDEFGALPADLAGDHPVRARLVESELSLAEVAISAQAGVALHPSRPEALTTMYSGTVVVRWQLAPEITPIEVIRVGGRRPVYGELACTDRTSVWVRDWSDLRRSREIPADLLPDYPLHNPVLSPDGRYLVVPSYECVRLLDLSREVVIKELEDFGDWSVIPRFTPDGHTIVIANSTQGSWWLAVLDVTDETVRVRYTRETDLPTAHVPEDVIDVAVSPECFACLVRPDGGGDALIVTAWTHSGETAWSRAVPATALCFAGDRLAVAQDSGVLWLSSSTGTAVGEDRTLGKVNALAARDTLVAATDHGLHYVRHP